MKHAEVSPETVAGWPENDICATIRDGGAMSKPNEIEISATAQASLVQTFSGELVKVGSSPVMGGA